MIISGQKFDEERALYGSDGLVVKDCSFDGPADGESAFKESRNIEVSDSYFNLRYPFWHDVKLKITNCEMTDKCRAAHTRGNHIVKVLEKFFHLLGQRCGLALEPSVRHRLPAAGLPLGVGNIHPQVPQHLQRRHTHLGKQRIHITRNKQPYFHIANITEFAGNDTLGYGGDISCHLNTFIHF